MKKILPLLLLCCACSGNVYESLNLQASREYLEPIRTDVPWNAFAKKFIYAPSFDFPESEGAAAYLFTLTPAEGDALSFKDASPRASLAPVWNKVPVGNVSLAVDALDAKGKVTARVGELEFLRDFPFQGPYPGPACDYRESAVKGMLFLHFMPEIQHWRTSQEPDMAYPHNTYPCKIISATIRNECLVAETLPELKDEALEIARGAGAYLLCDEVYRHLTQEESWQPSIVDLYEKGISTGSMSKVFSLAGLRLGWIATHDRTAMREFLSHRDYNHISCGMLDEAVASLALEHSEELLRRNRSIVRENLAILDGWINSEPHAFYCGPQAGTTALIHYDFDLPSRELCRRMFEETGAFVTPGDCFEEPRCFRSGYACNVHELKDGLNAVSAFFRKLEQERDAT